MSDYNVRLTRAAQTDMIEIHRYISEEFSSSVTADKMIDTIESSLAKLSRSPHSCVKVREDHFSAMGYRWIGIKNYIAFFTIDETSKAVLVERILYARRDWQQIL